MIRPHYILALFLLGASGAAVGAQSATHRVPQDFATIQDAVDYASPGDQIRVGPGEWCGATVDKTLELVGEGDATIVGCSTQKLFGDLRFGFFLPEGASTDGTSIAGFVFDGEEISDSALNPNLSPLAFAIFARQANDVTIEHNKILGTIQAITNTSGSRWSVNHNEIQNLVLPQCNQICGGGVGIVFQERSDSVRQVDNIAMFNEITGVIPDNFDLFSMGGILVLGGEDGTMLQKNRITIPDNPTSEAEGQAIVVSNSCCGQSLYFMTSINSTIVKNDGRDSEIGVLIAADSEGGDGNTEGAILRGNFGVNQIVEDVSLVSSRSIHTLSEY